MKKDPIGDINNISIFLGLILVMGNSIAVIGLPISLWNRDLVGLFCCTITIIASGLGYAAGYFDGKVSRLDKD